MKSTLIGAALASAVTGVSFTPGSDFK